MENRRKRAKLLRAVKAAGLAGVIGGFALGILLVGLISLWKGSAAEKDFSAQLQQQQEQNRVLKARYDETPEGLRELAADVDWNLVLVREEVPLEEGFSPKLEAVEGEYQLDYRVVSAAQEMLAAAREEGLNPVIISAYRDPDQQSQLFNQEVGALVNAGNTYYDAVRDALTRVAPPRGSEHSTGLALDIVSGSNQEKTADQETTPETKWLHEHCAEYGFIVRYPEGAQEITGITYEPWHYRYVGVEAAKAMTQQDITLEEYLRTL